MDSIFSWKIVGNGSVNLADFKPVARNIEFEFLLTTDIGQGSLETC